MGAQARQARGAQRRAARTSRRAFATIVGDPSRGSGACKYVIALDSDTQLPRDSARAARGHPRASAEPPRLRRDARARHRGLHDPAAARRHQHGELRRGRGSRGCSLASRASTPTRAPCRTSTRTCSTRARSSARASTTSMRCSARSAAGCPRTASSATICSKAAYARSGLVSDVVLVRGLPVELRGRRQPAPSLDPRRLADHARGCGRVVPAGQGGRVANPISRLSPWKILDNLRRSVVPIALWSCCSRLVGRPGRGPVRDARGARDPAVCRRCSPRRPGWRGGRARSAAGPATLARSRGRSGGSSCARRSRSRACRTMRCVSCDAIARTRLRVLVTGRRLLEWRTARDAQRAATRGLARIVRRRCGSRRRSRWPSSLALAARRRGVLAGGAACSRCGRWRRRGLVAEPADRVAAARRRWRRRSRVPARRSRDGRGGSSRRSSAPTTTTCLPTTSRRIRRGHGASHVADQHRPVAASPTSRPTTSATSRRDEVIERTTRTLASMDSMQRHRGHFYNWYDTHDARAAAADVRLDGRQRQPRRPPADARSRPRRAGDHRSFAPQIFGGLGDTLDVLAELAPSPGPKSCATIVARARSSSRRRRGHCRTRCALARAGPASQRTRARRASVVDATAPRQPRPPGGQRRSSRQCQELTRRARRSSRRGSSCPPKRRMRELRGACSTGRPRWPRPRGSTLAPACDARAAATADRG